MKNIRTQAYKADDVIDKFVLETKLDEEKSIWEWLFDFCSHMKRVENLANSIKDIRDSVRTIRQENPQIFQPNRTINLPTTLAREPQDTFLEVKNMVGLTEEANEVMKRLQIVGGTEEVECIAIVGMTGLGKTTLARKLWSDSQITDKFCKNIWVSVGQSNDLKNMLFVILKSSTVPNEEFRCNGENELAKLIAKFVTEQDMRCLVVLDNVCGSGLVNFFKNVLPENNKGHRILMTTRRRDVAASCASKEPYHLKFLDGEDSFRLLEKIVFDNGIRHRKDELVEVGKSIASKCGGLPLAIEVIAGALKKVDQSAYYWKRVENNFWQCVVRENDTSSCWKIVEASYGSLSSEMKACFLYCLAFPKGYDIPFQMLISLWMAEGLIESNPINFSSPKDKAEDHLMEFENLNLVTVSREITGSIKKIKCNEIFYDFYRMEVTKESVFQQLGQTHDLPSINDPDISRRLHIESSHLSDFISQNPSAEHVRSFLCFPSDDRVANVDIQLIPKAFPLLRVLKIESINIPSLKNLDQLFHLRYISISGNFTELPAFFTKFWSLQSIIINTSHPTLDVKANIWNMSKLTHLKTNKPSKLPLPSTQKGKRSSCPLQTLSKISPQTCNKDVLGEASNSLKKLSIQGNIEDTLKTNSDRFSTFEGFQTFEKFECLENLKLISDVPCHSNAFQLPKVLFRFLLKLKKLTLSNTMFDWKEATKLGQLRCLEVLKLEKEAFTGSIWKPEENEFRKLHILSIHSDDLHTWVASKSHFPELRVLVLKCPQLESVPAELSQLLQQS